MRIARLHHVSVHVRDLERARAFYRGVLRLEEIERPRLPCDGAWFRVGDGELHLIVPDEEEAKASGGLSPYAVHAALAIDDYEATLAELRAQGIEVLETSPTVGQMWIEDPDGNVIELIAR
ncbi:MAG: glyoxalase [Candidatus Dadabacteria bacterium]|nr:MAG: glyoxalase [Candidatus Dadabacteria bacterium]